MNGVFTAVLAQLRVGQKVFASQLRDGTSAGAACLGLMAEGKLPRIQIGMSEVKPAGIDGLETYQKRWKELAHA